LSREASFHITRSNNKTEKLGVQYLLEQNLGFIEVDKESRKRILKVLDIDPKFARSFDLVLLNGREPADFTQDTIEAYAHELVLVELKTTKKYLPNLPKGFFFGATENEFEFARLLGNQFRFCFVSLNDVQKNHALVSMPELEALIRYKRIQYQINL